MITTAKIYLGDAVIMFSTKFFVNSLLSIIKAHLKNIRNIISPMNQHIIFREIPSIPLDSGYSSKNFVILLENLVRKIIPIEVIKIQKIINNVGKRIFS